MPAVADLHALPPPSAEAAAHSARLLALIRAEIRAAGGAISFARFMELALYAPGLGYYRAGARKFGLDGDFITAPELSPLFSRCLARQCGEVLTALGGGSILELGAGTGRMAADLLRELQALNAHTLPERYAILEVSGELAERQRHTLAVQIPDLLERVEWLSAPPAAGFRGVILGNEVLDALPVERFHITANGPRRLMVGDDGKRLGWAEATEDAAVTTAVAAIEQALGEPLAEGYRSEYVPHLADWLAAIAAPLIAGALLWIDYGYPRRLYYHPQRHSGTLVCHYRHRVHSDPLILPGLQDITANVDFSAVADAGTALGFEVVGYTRQNYFLLGCGLLDLLAEAGPADSRAYLEQARQVKLLTLPGEMGDRFQVIALCRNLDQAAWRGFSLHNERYRL